MAIKTMGDLFDMAFGGALKLPSDTGGKPVQPEPPFKPFKTAFKQATIPGEARKKSPTEEFLEKAVGTPSRVERAAAIVPQDLQTKFREMFKLGGWPHEITKELTGKTIPPVGIEVAEAAKVPESIQRVNLEEEKDAAKHIEMTSQAEHIAGQAEADLTATDEFGEQMKKLNTHISRLEDMKAGIIEGEPQFISNLPIFVLIAVLGGTPMAMRWWERKQAMWKGTLDSINRSIEGVEKHQTRLTELAITNRFRMLGFAEREHARIGREELAERRLDLAEERHRFNVTKAQQAVDERDTRRWIEVFKEQERAGERAESKEFAREKFEWAQRVQNVNEIHKAQVEKAEKDAKSKKADTEEGRQALANVFRLLTQQRELIANKINILRAKSMANIELSKDEKQRLDSLNKELTKIQVQTDNLLKKTYEELKESEDKRKSLITPPIEQK